MRCFYIYSNDSPVNDAIFQGFACVLSKKPHPNICPPDSSDICELNFGQREL